MTGNMTKMDQEVRQECLGKLDEALEARGGPEYEEQVDAVLKLYRETQDSEGCSFALQDWSGAEDENERAVAADVLVKLKRKFLLTALVDRMEQADAEARLRIGDTLERLSKQPHKDDVSGWRTWLNTGPMPWDTKH